jgi:hypothetical protein
MATPAEPIQDPDWTDWEPVAFLQALIKYVTTQPATPPEA